MKKIQLLSCSLLLVGCFQSAPPSSPPPVPPTSPRTTLYELSFTDTTSKAPAVQLTRYQNTAAGYQKTQLTDANGSFKIERIGTASFSEDSTGKRYLQARFKITNNSGRAIQQLSLLPVDTDDDGNPSNNNGNVPTVENTAIKSLKLFDGTDASNKASNITLMRGQQYSITTETVADDPDATPYLGSLDVSAVNPVPPAGMVIAEVKDAGWQIPGIVGIGQSVNVTFGASYDMAKDGTGKFDPKNDPFSFSVMVAFTEDPVTSGLTLIHDIQGSTPSGDAMSPKVEQTVTIDGIVTSDLQGSSQFEGFFVQEENGDQDSDPTTSEGIFVQCSETCANVTGGDRVRLTGTVSERGEDGQETTLNSVTDVVVMAKGQALPSATAVVLSPTVNWEQYEGMYLSTSGVVTDNTGLGYVGGVTLADQRTPYFTQTNTPSSSGYSTFLKDSAVRSLVLDDGSTTFVPATLFGRDLNPLSLTNTLRNGDSATVSGVLAYVGAVPEAPETYRLHITTASSSFIGNPRPAVPSVGSGTLKTAHFNMGGYFNGDGAGDGFPMGRTSTLAEYNQQKAKVTEALALLDADIIALTGLEDDAGSSPSALQDLLDSLNAHTPSVGTYTMVNGKGQGILYRTSDLTPQGSPVAYNMYSSGLAQTFKQTSTSGIFTVVTGELRDRYQFCEVGDDLTSGQGRCAGVRTEQADDLMDWLATNPTGTTDPDVLLMGNFNAYAQEDPILRLLKGPDDSSSTADDFAAVLQASEYTSVDWGFTGTLDSAFVSASLASQLGGHGVWHINADEPVLFDYTNVDKQPGMYAPDAFRSSDRDPILIGLNLTTSNQAPTGIVLSQNTVAENGGANFEVATLSANDPDGAGSFTFALVSGTGSEDNASFEVSGNRLILKTSANLETKGSYSIRLQVTDPGGLTFEDTYTVTVTDVNEAPTALSLSKSDINENSAESTLVANLTGADPENNISGFLIVSQEHAGAFKVSGNQLQVADASKLNFEGDSSHDLTLQVFDAEGLTYNKTASITLNDVNEAPIVGNDTGYKTIGNTTMHVQKLSASGMYVTDGGALLLANDSDPDAGDSITVQSVTASSNASVSFDTATGAFHYTPAPDFTGMDTFSYTVVDSKGLTATGSISVDVQGKVWYVKTGANGNGTSISPFSSPNSLTALKPTGVGASVYIYSGTYNANVDLGVNQKAIGEGVSFGLSDISVPASHSSVNFTGRNAGTAPTINNGIIAAITAGDTEIRGFTIIPSSSYSYAINIVTSGASTTNHSLKVRNVTVPSAMNGVFVNHNGTGAYTIKELNNIDLQNITGSGYPLNRVTFEPGLTSSGLKINATSGSGFSLSGASGDWTINATGSSLSHNGTGSAVGIFGGTASITFNQAITNTGGKAVTVSGKTGGTLQFNGNITDTGTGIDLTNNTGATLNFAGKLNLSTTTSTAFNATGGGTVSASNTGNTITTSTGTGVNVQNTTIGSDGLKFQSINVNGAANGIALNNTGSGSLSVLGNGGTCTIATPTCTGGTIQSTTGAGVSLNGASNVTLNNVRVRTTKFHGVHAVGSSDITLSNSYFEGNGDGDDENSVYVVNGTGGFTVTGSQFNGAAENLMRVTNTTGNLTLSVSGSHFQWPLPKNSSFANSALLVEPQGTSVLDSTVQNNTFKNVVNASYQFAPSGTSTSVQNTRFLNNTLSVDSGYNVTCASSSECRVGNVYVGGTGGITHALYTGNNFNRVNGDGVFIIGANQSSTLRGRFDSNTIQNAIDDAFVIGLGQSAREILQFNGNTITNIGADAFEVASGETNAGFGTGSLSDLDLVITNNTMTNIGTNPSYAATGGPGIFRFGDSDQELCLAFTGNSVTGSATGLDVYLDGNFGAMGGTMKLEGAGTAAVTEANIKTLNPGVNQSNVVVSSVVFSNNVQCVRPGF